MTRKIELKTYQDLLGAIYNHDEVILYINGRIKGNVSHKINENDEITIGYVNHGEFKIVRNLQPNDFELLIKDGFVFYKE